MTRHEILDMLVAARATQPVGHASRAHADVAAALRKLPAADRREALRHLGELTAMNAAAQSRRTVAPSVGTAPDPPKPGRPRGRAGRRIVPPAEARRKLRVAKN